MQTVFAHGVKLNNLKKKIQQGLGTQKADIVLRGGKVFDLITGDFLEGDVAITGDTIVGTCASYDAKKVIDVKNQFLVPGFIDTHLHICLLYTSPSPRDRG